MTALPRIKQFEDQSSGSNMKSPKVNAISARRKRAKTSANSPANVGEENAAYLLRQVAERLGISLVHALKPFNQMPSVYRVLIALTRKNPVRMRDLIDLTLIEASMLSRTVARMKGEGLLRVVDDNEDGRSFIIFATEQGQALLEAMLPAISAQFNWAVHDVPPEDIEVVRRTLQRMLHNLRISPIR